MAVNNVVNLGIGSPARIEHLITLGLEASPDRLLSAGDTGYSYAPPSAAPASLTVGPAPGGAPS